MTQIVQLLRYLRVSPRHTDLQKSDLQKSDFWQKSDFSHPRPPRSLTIAITLAFTALALLTGVLAAQAPAPSPAAPLQEASDPFLNYLPVLASYRPPPGSPAQPWPANEATAQSVNLYFTWDVRPITESIQSYEIYVKPEDWNWNEPVGVTEDPVYIPDELALNTRYYWRVVSVLADGRRIPGPLWTLRTEDPAAAPAVETLITVPAGWFTMGCDASNPAEIPCFPEEVPLHDVYVDAFQIDKYEVTNGQYGACVAAGACAPPLQNNSHTRKNYFGNPDYSDFPVLYVSWWNAQAYCRWSGKRLPYEAEWEKAARGTVDTRMWPWGNESPNCERLNYTDDSNEDNWTVCVNDTTRVGTYPTSASPYGVMDMAGNAFEWVSDFYDVTYYYYTPVINPTGPVTGTHFTLRGGSYRPRWYYPRVAHRHWGHHGPDNDNNDAPYYRNDQVGFRCVKEIED